MLHLHTKYTGLADVIVNLMEEQVEVCAWMAVLMSLVGRSCLSL